VGSFSREHDIELALLALDLREQAMKIQL